MTVALTKALMQVLTDLNNYARDALEESVLSKFATRKEIAKQG